MKYLFVFLIGIFIPAKANAVNLTDITNSQFWNCEGFLKCNGSTPPTNAVADITLSVITTVFYSISALAVVAIMYGGIRMAISQGDEGKEAGKKALIWATVGLILAVLTYDGNRICNFIIQFIYTIGGGTAPMC